MARRITVFRDADAAFVAQPPGIDSPDMEAWEAEVERRCLYDDSLGSEDDIRRFWSEPARALSLPLLANLYEAGFIEAPEWRGPTLDLLARELDRLEALWRADLEEPQVADLLEMAGLLRDAIRLARDHAGFVCVS